MKQQKNLSFFITIFVFFLIFIIMNGLCPYLSDDWHFMFVWEDFDPLPSTHRVENIHDIIISMKNYYAKSGGRVIPHLLAYLFMTQNKWLFNILNSIMSTLLFYLFYRIGMVGSKEKYPFLFPFIGAMAFFCIPYFGDNMLWLSGAVNYLWSGVILLICLGWLISKWQTASFREFVLIIPLFIISSATNEITGGMLAVALILQILVSEHKRIKRGLILFISIIPGICFVVLSNGNNVRRQNIEIVAAPSLKEFIITSLKYLEALLLDYWWIDIIILTAIFLSIFLHLNWKRTLQQNLLALVAISGTAALGAVGTFIGRPVFFGSILLIATSVRSFIFIYEEYQTKKSIKFFILLSSSLLLALAFMLTITLFSLIPLHNVLIDIVMIVIIAIVAILGIKLEKIINQLQLTENIIQFLKRIKNKLPRLNFNFLFFIIVPLFLIHFSNYLQWTKNYKEYQKQLIYYIEKGKLEKAVIYPKISIRDFENELSFVPCESAKVSSYYQVEWIAVYYGQDVTELVKEKAIKIAKQKQ